MVRPHIQRDVTSSSNLGSEFARDSPLEESRVEPAVPFLRKGLPGVGEGRSPGRSAGSSIKLTSARETAMAAAAMTVKEMGPVIGAGPPAPFHFAVTCQQKGGCANCPEGATPTALSL